MPALTPTHPLIAGLIDDAAVFPPGSSPLPEAVTAHRRHRLSPYAAAIGPLLVPYTDADALPALAGDQPLAVVLVGRPTARIVDVITAARGLQGSTVEVVGVEAGWTPTWAATVPPGLPVALELPRGLQQDLALREIRAGRADGLPVQAKFRTGATSLWPWPVEAELAQVLRRVVAEQVPLKLTGGLHHVVRGTHGPGSQREEQHGLLNVLLAVDAARAGAGAAEVEAVLAIRDAEALSEAVLALDAREARGIRETFTAYGCCGVTDPLQELAGLDLLVL